MEKIILKGVPVYTSDELKEKLKKMIKKIVGGETRTILILLIDNNMLVPIINESNKLKQLIMKIRRQQPLLNIQGVMDNGVCYVIFHDNIPDKWIVNTSLHEIIHLASFQSPQKFGTINMSLYMKYYAHFFKLLFESKSYDKEILRKFVEKLVNEEFEGGYLYPETYYNLLGDAFKDYTVLPKESFKSRRILLWRCVVETLEISDKMYHYNLVYTLLRKTYRDLFKGMDYTAGVGQELYFPSEIISILSTINSEHPNVIKSLELIVPGKKPVVKNLIKKIFKK